MQEHIRKQFTHILYLALLDGYGDPKHFFFGCCYNEGIQED